MTRTQMQLLQGLLQDASEQAMELLDATLSGSSPNCATDEAAENLVQACTDLCNAAAAYSRSVADEYRDPEYQSETDPGPSQAQRL